jgi:alanine or glycine:cation symporter, AGCS family
MLVDQLVTILLGWPLLLYVLSISIICTIAFAFIQLRYFFYAWRITLFPAPETVHTEGIPADMTPLQAFINTLSSNLGNGSIAGMATAIYSGGPGAAVWVVLIGLLLMSVRFAEVYLSTYFGATAKSTSGIGGPMLYLKSVAGGTYLAPTYAFLCLLFSLLIGNAMQTNSIRISLQTTWNIPPLVSAFLMLLFIMYIIFGGARRIVAASETIVPIKVATFFISSIIVLVYHYATLIPALTLMIKSAFQPMALGGGALGFTVQQAMRYGILRSTMATESGVGTAAILFSATGSKEPVKDGIISMLSTFISTLVCFIVAWCIVASGVWDNGSTSTALTIAAYETVFGWISGWVVSFLSVSFGMGVLVSFAYITREAWLSVTGGKFEKLFCFVFCAVAFIGAIINATFVFKLGDFIIAAMLVINLFAIVYFLPLITKSIAVFHREQ